MRPSILATIAAVGSLLWAPLGAHAQPVVRERALDLPIDDLSPNFAGISRDGSAIAIEAVSYDRRYLAVFDTADLRAPRYTVELVPMARGGGGQVYPAE